MMRWWAVIAGWLVVVARLSTRQRDWALDFLRSRQQIATADVLTVTMVWLFAGVVRALWWELLSGLGSLVIVTLFAMTSSLLCIFEPLLYMLLYVIVRSFRCQWVHMNCFCKQPDHNVLKNQVKHLLKVPHKPSANCRLSNSLLTIFSHAYR